MGSKPSLTTTAAPADPFKFDAEAEAASGVVVGGRALLVRFSALSSRILTVAVPQGRSSSFDDDDDDSHASVGSSPAMNPSSLS